MFESKSKFLAISLKVILNIVWFLGLMFFVSSAISIPLFINNNKDQFLLTLSSTLLLLSVVGCVLVIIYQLRKILKTVIDGCPFVLDNVHRFRKISFSTLGLGVYILVDNIFKRGYGVLTFLETSQDGIYSNIGIWIPFVLAIFSLIIAEIFKQAHEIYEDNKLTI